MGTPRPSPDRPKLLTDVKIGKLAQPLYQMKRRLGFPLIHYTSDVHGGALEEAKKYWRNRN